MTDARDDFFKGRVIGYDPDYGWYWQREGQEDRYLVSKDDLFRLARLILLIEHPAGRPEDG